MPLEAMQRVKPELLESFIYPSLLGCEGAQAWEQKFMQMAKANDMEVNGLEQAEDQLKIFDDIPYTVQAQEFAETMLNIDSVKKEFNKMLVLYKQKDLAGLNNIISASDEYTAYNDALLDDRNKKWISEI